MKVVLRTDVSGLGRRGDVTDVADGFARNYLLPKGLALAATPGLALHDRRRYGDTALFFLTATAHGEAS